MNPFQTVSRYVKSSVTAGWFLHSFSSYGGSVAGTCGYGEGLSGSINAGKFLTSWQSSLVSFSRRTLLHGVSKCKYGGSTHVTAGIGSLIMNVCLY
jgi:hypothetical protein